AGLRLLSAHVAKAVGWPAGVLVVAWRMPCLEVAAGRSLPLEGSGRRVSCLGGGRSAQSHTPIEGSSNIGGGGTPGRNHTSSYHLHATACWDCSQSTTTAAAAVLEHQDNLHQGAFSRRFRGVAWCWWASSGDDIISFPY
ncbi:Hypothetical protein, putative, partial [Bodo saltans]